MKTLTAYRTPTGHKPDPAIEHLDVSVYTVPTDGPDGQEADGTLVWNSTTIVVVEVHAAGEIGIGYTYANAAAATLIESKLAPHVRGKDPLMVGALWHEMLSRIRNEGRPGLGSMAVSAVDIALHDLRAKLLGTPLFRALGAFHETLPIYGSGGFCNYSIDRLVAQSSRWAVQGITLIKLKTSRHPNEDPSRLDAVRAAIGDMPLLMTDANGALSRKQALYWAHRFREEWGVVWMEEPVPSADLDGLRLLRNQAPPGLEIAAGEYGFVARDFADLLAAGAVDCLQADVTRCGGITGLLQVAGMCSGHAIDLSAHCAPAISAHAFCAVERVRHLEYFHDHVRLESMVFDGVVLPRNGVVSPDGSRPGLGLKIKRRDMEPYRVKFH